MDTIQLSARVMRDNRDVVEIVGGLLVQTDALQNQHGLMFSQFSKLSGKTIELTALTQNAILEVNSSFAEVKAVFDLEQHSRSRYLWNSCAMWVLERLLHFDASSAEEFLRLPMFGGLATCIGALLSLLRIGISVAMSAIVVLSFTSRQLMTCLLAIVSGPQTVRRSSDFSGESHVPHSVVGISTPHSGAWSHTEDGGRRQKGEYEQLLLRRDRSHNRRGRVSRIPDWLCRSGWQSDSG